MDFGRLRGSLSTGDAFPARRKNLPGDGKQIAICQRIPLTMRRFSIINDADKLGASAERR
jgi:hypothetical protein